MLASKSNTALGLCNELVSVMEVGRVCYTSALLGVGQEKDVSA